MTVAPADSLERVGDFLEKFYFGESNDIVATTAALSALKGFLKERGLLALAFCEVLEASYPEGTLYKLVERRANRSVANDVDARGFLWKVYNMNVLDYAPLAEDEPGLV
jgi:hypothetical protein